MAGYERIGGGTYGIYRRKPNVLGWIVGIVLVLLILGAMADGNKNQNAPQGTPIQYAQPR